MSGIPKGGMTKVRGSAARGTAKEALTNASSWCSQPASTSRRADCRFRCEHCRMPASISERCQRAVNRDKYTRGHADMHRQRSSSQRYTVGLSRPHMRCYAGRVQQIRSPWHISFEHCPFASPLAGTIRECTRSVRSAWTHTGHRKSIHATGACLLSGAITRFAISQHTCRRCTFHFWCTWASCICTPGTPRSQARKPQPTRCGHHVRTAEDVITPSHHGTFHHDAARAAVRSGSSPTYHRALRVGHHGARQKKRTAWPGSEETNDLSLGLRLDS